jgi:hypothetical protein
MNVLLKKMIKTEYKINSLKKEKKNKKKKQVLKKSLTIGNHKEESFEIIKYWNRIAKINPYFTKHGFEGKGIKSILIFLDRIFSIKKVDYLPFISGGIKHSLLIYSRLILDGIIDPPMKGKVSIVSFFKGDFKTKINYFKIIKDPEKLKSFKKKRGNSKQFLIVKKKLTEAYKEHVLGEKRVRFTKIQEDQLDLAAKRLTRFFIGNRKLNYLDFKSGATIDDFIRALITSLKKHYKNFGFGIGHLCSNYTFNEILPKYINLNKPR